MNKVIAQEVALPTVELVEDVSANLPSVPGALQIQSVDRIVPERPKHVSDKRDKEIKKEAVAIVAALLKNPSDIEITATLYGLGRDAEASNASNVALVEQKIGPVMKEIGTESMLGKSLIEIKSSLDLVNPHVVAKTEGDFKGALFGLIPRVVRRLPKSDEVMALINERRDTIRSTIDALKGHLWEERDKALRNAVELGQVANRLADAQAMLQEAAYQGQLIWEGLSVALASETDPVRKQALTYLINDLAVKVVDIQTVDQLNIQSRMGAETLINNCRGIQMLVGRVTNTLLPSVMTALVVKAAALQQAQLAAAARGIGAAAGETIAQTAREIGQVSVDIAKTNSDSLIDINKLEEACDAYERMQLELHDVMQAAEKNARGISNRMSALNERMRNRTDPLTAARQAREAAGV